MIMRLLIRAAGLMLLLSVTLVSNSNAQIRALIKVGVNGSTLRGRAESDFSPILRLSGGAGVIMNIGSHLQFQSEILYVVKGSQVEGDPFHNDNMVEATFDLTYLEVPLLLAYQFRSAKLKPRIFVGPTIAVKLDSQIRFRAISGGPTQTQEDESVENRDVGLLFGFGIETDIGSETLMMGLQSSIGFSNARKENPDRPDNPPLYNTSVGLFVGIVF